MLNNTTKADLFRHEGNAGIRSFLKCLLSPGFGYTFVFRKSEKYKKNLVLKAFYKFLKWRFRVNYGYEICANAQIGEGLYLSSHPGHIIIGPVKMGKNCNVNHSVTIGRAYKNGVAGRPTIDDLVWIGTGAVLVGNIYIGKNVLIAPNTFVNFDVPANSLVIGNPAKIIKKNNPTENYINHIWEN